MINRTYGEVGLEGLFSRLYGALTGEAAPAAARLRSPAVRDNAEAGDLFSEPPGGTDQNGDPTVPAQVQAAETAAETAERAAAAERVLVSYSPWARLDFIYAWMSELPIEREILAFAAQVIGAGRDAERSGAGAEAVRAAAETARTDRGESAVRVTLAAVQKVTREEHRLIGLLRFSEWADGRLVARCACDHAVLPALADHFSRRFGARHWAIVDERRDWALVGDPKEPPRLLSAAEAGFRHSEAGVAAAMNAKADEWEDLWRGYHRSIAIESRMNPVLQRRLMPVRYWKYLTELR